MSDKQHYVPQIHLKGFLDPSTINSKDPYLWVVDLEEQLIGKRAPKNIAFLSGYYNVSMLGNEEITNESMFDDILKTIESKASSTIRKIRQNNFNLTIEDRFNLSNFIGLQIGRVPIFREHAAKTVVQIYEERLNNLLDDEEKIKQKFGEDSEGFKEYIHSIKGKILPKKDFLVPATLKIGFDFAEMIFGMTWTFFVATGKSKFFSSDNPAMLLSNNKSLKIEFGVINKDLEVAFPISPSCALLAHNHTYLEEIKEVDTKSVNRMNWKIFGAIKRYIFCSTKSQAEYLLKDYGVAKEKSFSKEP